MNLKAGKVSIQRAAVRVAGQGVMMLPPKTERGRRAIVLDHYTVDVLRAHRRAQLVKVVELDGVYSDQGYVFPNQIGGRLRPIRIARRIAQAHSQSRHE